MFWLVISNIFGSSLVLISFFREKRDRFSWIILILGLATIFISFPVYFLDKKEMETLTNRIDNSSTIKLQEQIDYLEVSKLNIFGLSIISAADGLKIISPLSNLLEKYLSVKDGALVWQCSEEALGAYRKIISDMPKFPFSYYFLGGCIKRIGGYGWAVEMKKAQDILEITISIPDHHINHDQVLAGILDELK